MIPSASFYWCMKQMEGRREGGGWGGAQHEVLPAILALFEIIHTTASPRRCTGGCSSRELISKCTDALPTSTGSMKCRRITSYSHVVQTVWMVVVPPHGVKNKTLQSRRSQQGFNVNVNSWSTLVHPQIYHSWHLVSQ